jgi:hypothetical protein
MLFGSSGIGITPVAQDLQEFIGLGERRLQIADDLGSAATATFDGDARHPMLIGQGFVSRPNQPLDVALSEADTSRTDVNALQEAALDQVVDGGPAHAEDGADLAHVEQIKFFPHALTPRSMARWFQHLYDDIIR